MPTLTDIQQGYMDILETLALGCDEDTETAALSMLDELGAMESDKVDAIGAVLRKYDADEKHLRDEAQRLQRAAQSMSKARDRFRAYLLRVMQQNGSQKLKGKATTLYISNRQSVHISVPAEQLPSDYVEHVVEIKPLKANIAAALKEGKDVPGALLVEQQTMSKPKFTPGPWERQDDYSRLISTKPEPNEFSPTGTSLPTVMRPDFQAYGYCDDGIGFVDISDSDANLIAAAPEMYEAAEAALECLQNNGFGKAYVEDLLNSALRKARGES